MRSLSVIAALAFGTLVVGCGTADDDPNPDMHGCSIFAQSQNWSGKSLKIEHTEPRNCPATDAYGDPVEPNSPMMTSGWVIQTNLDTLNQEFEDDHALEANLTIENYDRDFVVHTGYKFFGWELEEGDWEWKVYLDINYDALTAYDPGDESSAKDFGVFDVTWEIVDPIPDTEQLWAEMVISYDVDSGCSGPGC